MSGAALVSTENGGVRSYASGIAIFVPRGDVDRLSEAIIDLLQDETECQRLALSGLTRLSSYGPADAGRKFLVALENAVGADK